MKKGDIVIWNKVPGVNTPGVPDSQYACTGTVVNESYPSGAMFRGSEWCDVLWSNNQVTKCYKKDLRVVNV